MIIFDTNLVSELMREEPEHHVVEWVAGQDPARFFTTVITQVEVLTGLALLPSGRRRTRLEAAAGSMFSEDFSGRILPLDEVAVPVYADLAVQRARSRAKIPAFDLMIAAIAHAHDAAVATRNVKDFTGCGITVIDPWAA